MNDRVNPEDTNRRAFRSDAAAEPRGPQSKQNSLRVGQRVFVCVVVCFVSVVPIGGGFVS